MQIVQQKVYTSVGQSRDLFKEDTPHSSGQFKLKHRERDGRAAWEAGGSPEGSQNAQKQPPTPIPLPHSSHPTGALGRGPRPR